MSTKHQRPPQGNGSVLSETPAACHGAAAAMQAHLPFPESCIVWSALTAHELPRTGGCGPRMQVVSWEATVVELGVSSMAVLK
jgi:hypothetical protein